MNTRASFVNRTIKYVLTIFSILAVSFVLLEVGTRLLFPKLSYDHWRAASLRYVYHPAYHWRIRPGKYSRKGGKIIEINSAGLRGPEVSTEKKSGTLRVLVLGGSSTFNAGARNGRTWSVQLASFLGRRLGIEVEVMNAGTPGYTTYQSSMRLKEQLIEYKPDLVIVYHLWNDMKVFSSDDTRQIIKRWDMHGKKNENKSLLDPFPFLDIASRYSQFVTYSRLAGIEIAKRIRNVDVEGWVHTELDREILQEGVDFYRTNLERIVHLCKAEKIPVALVKQVLLTQPRTKAHEPEIKYKYVGFDHDTYLKATRIGYEVIDSLAEQEGVWSIETKSFPVNNTGYTYMQDNVHFTIGGLKKLVEVIGPQIENVTIESRAPQKIR